MTAYSHLCSCTTAESVYRNAHKAKMGSIIFILENGSEKISPANSRNYFIKMNKNITLQSDILLSTSKVDTLIRKNTATVHFYSVGNTVNPYPFFLCQSTGRV